MKKLYFWNDFNVFYRDESLLAQIDEKFSVFFHKISNDETKYVYLSYTDIKIWEKKLQAYVETPNIYLGTRPDRIFESKKPGSVIIYPKRERDASGMTKSISLSKEDRELLKEYSKRESEIRIIEDVMVCGVTMENLLDEIVRETESKRVIIEFFLENRSSAKKIHEKYGNRVSTDYYMQMQGVSLKESTCICAYDLLEGKIKGMNYDESFEKLKYYFGEHTSDFLDLYKGIRNQLKKRCKRK